MRYFSLLLVAMLSFGFSYGPGGSTGGSGSGATESSGGVTKVSNTTDDFMVGENQCETANDVVEDCFYVDTETGSVSINRADDTGATWSVVPPKTDGEQRCLASEASQGGSHCYSMDSDFNDGEVTNLTETYPIQPRVLLWDSEDETTGWDATMNPLDIGGSGVKDTAPFTAIEIHFSGLLFTTAGSKSGTNQTDMYYYLLDSTGTALTGSDYFEGEHWINTQGETGTDRIASQTAYGYMEGFMSQNVGAQVGNGASGVIRINNPAYNNMGIRGTWDIIHNEGVTGAAEKVAMTNGYFVYRNGSVSTIATGIRFEAYDNENAITVDIDASGLKARIYGIR